MFERRTWLTLALLLLPAALLVLGAEQLGVRLLERIAINLCISLTLVVGLQVGVVKSYDNTMELALHELGVSYRMLDSLGSAHHRPFSRG